MKKLVMLVILILMMSSFVVAGTITRSFNPSTVAPGSDVEVTLTWAKENTDNKLVITEDYPDEFSVSDIGSFDDTEPGKLKFAAASNVFNFLPLTFTYTLTAPSTAGSYNFAGTYILIGTSSVSTGGVSSLTIQQSQSTTCPVPCASGLTCVDGRCVFSRPGGQIICSSSNLGACVQSNCAGAGGHWYNNRCNAAAQSTTCPDVPCASGLTCVDGRCVTKAVRSICGDGTCDADEGCASCAVDCKCNPRVQTCDADTDSCVARFFSPCSLSNLAACTTQASCESIGAVWLNNACEMPSAPAGTLGESIDEALKSVGVAEGLNAQAEDLEQSWTTDLISKLASIFKSFFG